MEEKKMQTKDRLELEYYKQREKLEDMCKNLNDLREEFTDLSVRCSILQVDLATQFNPQMNEALDETIQECDRCQNRIDALLDPENDAEFWKLVQELFP